MILEILFGILMIAFIAIFVGVTLLVCAICCLGGVSMGTDDDDIIEPDYDKYVTRGYE